MANDGWHKAWTEDLDKIVQDRAAYYKVDPNDIRRIIWHESRGNPEAKNPKSSASGLMQLLQGTFKLKNPFDPYENIDRGTKYYADMLKQFKGDKALAARAYAWGPGWTSQWLRNGRSLDGMSDLARSTFNTGEEFSSYMTGSKPNTLPPMPTSTPTMSSPVASNTVAPGSAYYPGSMPTYLGHGYTPARVFNPSNDGAMALAWNMLGQYAPHLQPFIEYSMRG